MDNLANAGVIRDGCCRMSWKYIIKDGTAATSA